MKHIISGLALSAVLLTGVAASAGEATKKSNKLSSTDNLAVRPYVGLDLGGYYNKRRESSSTKHTITIPFIPNAGLRIGDYLGLEAGYMPGVKQSRRSQSSTIKSQIGVLYLDGRAYAPITQKLEAIASVGIGKYTRPSSNKPIFRLGGGLQYNVTENLGVRGMIHYNMHTRPVTKHNVLMSTVGINFTF